MKEKPILYIIIPCYNEQEVLPLTAPMFREEVRLLTEAGKIDAGSRILFVNDGSRDKTWEIIQELSRQDPCFQGLCLSRNRGHQNALLAGLMEAKGRAEITISIDCDGQDDPGAMEQMVDAYLAGNEIVYGVRSSRASDTFFKRTSARLFYKLMKAAGAETVYDHADYRLLSARVLRELENYHEVNLYLRGLIPLVGFQSTTVSFERKERKAGETHYPLSRMLKLAGDGITSFSTAPLRMISVFGAVIALMFMFFHPFVSEVADYHFMLFTLHFSLPKIVTGLLTLTLIAPFLRAMVMKKNHSEEFKALWNESNRNRLPLLFTILVRVVIAVAFVFAVVSHLAHVRPAVVMMIGIGVVVLVVFSRRIKRRSILLERLFINNLRSRDIEAQVHGKKRPLYEGRLLDRDVHIADFEVPATSLWMGSTLKQLSLGKKYGVHVSSILRGTRRLNIPDGDSIIFPGDRLQVIGSDSQLDQLRHAIETEVQGDDYEVEKREMKLQQFIITKRSPFLGKTLEESGIRSTYSCMVVGLEEGKENLSAVRPKHRFEDGDILWVVGEQEALSRLLSAR